MLAKLERNINILYISGILGWARFFLPVMALFYISSEVTLIEFSIIMSIFSLVILLFEIPSGVFADLVGKKISMICGVFCFVIEIFILLYCLFLTCCLFLHYLLFLTCCLFLSYFQFLAFCLFF